MPLYFPIDVGFSFKCGQSDLVAVDWKVNKLMADFVLPDEDSHVIRVSFDNQTIVRLLDEMPLSTEDDLDDVKGLVPNHFAYRVEGAKFAAIQSETWMEVAGPIQHYQFITGWGCMDVLSRAEPSFKVVEIKN